MLQAVTEDIQARDTTTSPLISVCIPTYNFGAFIGETLASVLPQAGPGVEVLVVDGASTDDTRAVVTGMQPDWPRLRYVRLESRGGIDADMALSVELAHGEYCWLFSSDDIMRPGALARVRDWLQEGHDVYVCEHSLCNKNMQYLCDYPLFEPRIGPRRVQLGDRQQRLRCLADAVNTECLFSFMSGLVVRREVWRSVPPVPEFMGSCWGHVARLLSVARERGLSACYVEEVWLDKRGENDSFADRGLVNRLRIGIDGFLELAATFFGRGSPEEKEVRKFLRNELPLSYFSFAWDVARKAPGREDMGELRRLFALVHGPWTSLTLTALAFKARGKAGRVLAGTRRRLGRLVRQGLR